MRVNTQRTTTALKWLVALIFVFAIYETVINYKGNDLQIDTRKAYNYNDQNKYIRVRDWFVNDVGLLEEDSIKYFNIFIDEGFDRLEEIKDMNENDLKDIKITKKGHIKTLLKAINKLNNIKVKEIQELNSEHNDNKYLNDKKTKFVDLQQSKYEDNDMAQYSNYNETIFRYLEFKKIEIVKPIIADSFDLYNFYSEQIIVVVLSCGRWNLLEKTLLSFEKYNTFKNIYSKTVIDDCNDVVGLNLMATKFGLNTIYNYNFTQSKLSRKKGFEDTAKRAVSNIELFISEFIEYKKVNDITKVNYFFQMEDDWLFFRYGFIEDSFAVMNNNVDHENNVIISTLFLRNANLPELWKNQSMMDGNSNICGGLYYGNQRIYESDIRGYNNRNIYYYLAINPSRYYHSFTNNPHLNKFDHYIEIKTKQFNTTNINYSDPRLLWNEMTIGYWYKQYNFKMALPIDNGYMCHIGHLHHKYPQRFRLLIGNEQNQTSDIYGPNYLPMCIPKQDLLYSHRT